VPNVLPPVAYAGTPSSTTVSAGTTLFRVHAKAHKADSFNPVPSHRYYGGGRFDCTDDDLYAYLYAGKTVDVAISETLLRDLYPDDKGIRKLPRSKIVGRRISAVELTIDLEVVTLRSGADLGAVAQDTWLTTCDPRDYPQSRHWGHWIRAHAPSAHGYVWLSKRDPTQESLVFFGDRVPHGSVIESGHAGVPAGDKADFDTPRGKRELRGRLARYGVALSRV
jgi:hypothetical protein